MCDDLPHRGRPRTEGLSGLLDARGEQHVCGNASVLPAGEGSLRHGKAEAHADGHDAAVPRDLCLRRLQRLHQSLHAHETNKKTMVSGFVRFILKKCDSDVKMGWIHSDFVATGLGTKQNRKIYSQLDKIICVSKATKTSFLSLFPELESKCDYCYNYLPVDEIRKKSLSESISFGCDEGVVFFSACRFVAEKGIERTIMAMLPLWKEGLKFKWYIAGNGIEYAKIEHLIHNYNIHDKVILLGYKENPYPYMKAADWFLLSSYHETFSMVAAESMIVGTPVLATDLPVVRELIDENSGYICHNSVEGIKDAIKDIVSQKKSIKVQLRENLVNSKGQFERIFQ